MPKREESRVYSTDEVRGAEIELRKPWQWHVFVGGLVAAILFALVMTLLGMV